MESEVLKYLDRLRINQNPKRDSWIKEYFERYDNKIEPLLFTHKSQTMNRNQNLLTEEQATKLRKVNDLSDEIRDLKCKIEKVKHSHSTDSSCSYGVNFMYGETIVTIRPEDVNFPALKKQVLSSMQKRLKSLEKEFADI